MTGFRMNTNRMSAKNDKERAWNGGMIEEHRNYYTKAVSTNE